MILKFVFETHEGFLARSVNLTSICLRRCRMRVVYVNWAVLLRGREFGLRARGHCFKPYEVIVLYRLRKAKKKTKTSNRYSQVTHLTRDTVLERSHKRVKSSFISQLVITGLQGTDKTVIKTNIKHK